MREGGTEADILTANAALNNVAPPMKGYESTVYVAVAIKKVDDKFLTSTSERKISKAEVFSVVATWQDSGVLRQIYRLKINLTRLKYACVTSHESTSHWACDDS